MRKSGAVLAVCALVVLGERADGQTTWINPGTGDWFTNANWTGGTPTSAAPFHLPGLINNGGTAQITGGSASAWELKVGDAGVGTLHQTGGTLKMAAPSNFNQSLCRLWVGALPGSNGTFQLSGSSSQVTTGGEMFVGYGGTGLVQQSAGMVSAPVVAVGAGNSATGTGRYEISGGTLKTPRLHIGGQNAAGHVVQTGGTVTIGGGGVGDPFVIRSALPGADPRAVYEIHGGTLGFDPSDFSRVLRIGEQSGPALFRQGGGTVNARWIELGNFESSGRTRLEISGGTLNATAASPGVGIFTVGSPGHQSPGPTVTQTGGQVNADLLRLSHGTWQQNGGAVNATSRVSVGYYNGATMQAAQWTLGGGGVLTAPEVYVTDSGGSGELHVGAATLSTGVLQVADTFYASKLALTDAAADVTVSSKLVFGPKAVFTAVPGATIKMTGSQFDNRSTSPADLAGLNNLTLIFKGGAAVLDPFEVAGADLGASEMGFEENFALASLRIGDGETVGRVQLIDAFDNHAATPDALYVGELVLAAGSHLDLNGRTLYYRSFIDQGGTIATGGGGQLVSVPEPASLAIFAMTLGATSLRRRRHHRQRPLS